MLRRVDKLETIPQRLGLIGRKCLLQRSRSVRIHVVHYQRDLHGIPIVHGYVLEKLRPVGFSLAFGYLGHPSACQRFTGHEDIANATTFVLVVEPLWPMWSCWKRRARFSNQLARRLVHAHHRKSGTVRTSVYIDNPIHGCNKIAVCFRRNYPADLLPGLDFVFFKTRRIVSCETLSMYWSSTTRSASRRSDQRAKPCGGLLQLSATKCASKSPSAFFSWTRWPWRLPKAASKPSSTKRFLTRSTLRMLILRTFATSTPRMRYSLNSPSSQFKRTNALTTLWDWWDPLRVIASRSSLSSFCRVTLYFFIGASSLVWNQPQLKGV